MRLHIDHQPDPLPSLRDICQKADIVINAPFSCNPAFVSDSDDPFPGLPGIDFFRRNLRRPFDARFDFLYRHLGEFLCNALQNPCQYFLLRQYQLALGIVLRLDIGCQHRPGQFVFHLCAPFMCAASDSKAILPQNPAAVYARSAFSAF